jgi:hypothetical protein
MTDSVISKVLERPMYCQKRAQRWNRNNMTVCFLLRKPNTCRIENVFVSLAGRMFTAPCSFT